ncbi:allophanate hydrolase subunit 1 [Inquilinus sp. YAF38]|uniref:5-oxoprolinase subunit B family protein n=1 Tax=Inquilinus sp. YAF38 TaxID=3233084 RepID=UPI003F8DF419
MIYETPAFRPGGDRYMLIEFGNEMNLELNFMAQGLATAIAEQKTKGVIETAPCFASMLIHYEPDEISYADLSRELERLIAALGPSDDIELESRIFYFPTVYLDPWTRDCVQDYIAKIAPKQTDPEFVAELNGLSDVAQFVQVHSGTEYWVAALGFWPGLPFMMALDPRCKLTAPKYNPPRTWTPKGTVGMGGASTAIYPEHLPGGYQIFGRIPVPIWDPEKRFDVFTESICLFRPGDRVKFVPCTVEEFEEAEQRVADGSYVYNVVEYQKFSVRQYKRWVGSLDLARRF